jgi:hypothetical protein
MMYLQREISRKTLKKKNGYCWGLERVNDPDPDPSVRGTDPRIRIRNKLLRIPNTDFYYVIHLARQIHSKSELILNSQERIATFKKELKGIYLVKHLSQLERLKSR